MKLLLDIGHPAHVHLFRNAARTLHDRGHHVTVAIRDKPIIKDLLRSYGHEHVVASAPRDSITGLAWELIEHDLNILRLTKQHGFDVLAGTSVAAAHVSRVTRAKSVVFSEDDARVVKLFAALTYPFADKVVVPSAISDKRRRNYVTHESYHELAYLHPNHFHPDHGITTELGLTAGEQYSIIRLVAFKAHHDVGQEGIGPQLQHQLVDLLAGYGKVFITVEGEMPQAFKPYQMTIPAHRMHDALAFARIVVTDSQTMTAEAAVLGVPTIRCNSFVGRLAYLEELEERYGLTYGFLPSNAASMLATLRRLLDSQDLYADWQKKREHMLSEKIDLHLWMVEFFETLVAA